MGDKKSFQFRKIKLKNGLVILHEKRDIDVTTVMLATRFGSGYESEQEKGIAHFVEHLCFRGTKKRTSREIAFGLEKVGGVLNAFTSEEETAYHVKLPSDYLELAIDIIFDVFFNPIFPEEEIEKERNVICEEIKMYRDNPSLHILKKIKELLYENPFGIFGAGSLDSVKKITREELIEKHKQMYCSENAILCVVGNNKFEDVVKFAERFSVEGNFKSVKMPEIKLRNKEEKEIRKDLEQANIVLGFHFPFKQRYACEIFSVILGQGMSSKLFEEVREKRGLVYAIKSEIEIGKNYGYMIIYAGTDKNKTEEVKKICLEEFRKMKNLGEEELEDGKKQVIGNYDIASEDSANAALGLILNEVFEKAEDYYDYEKKIRGVSLEDIKELAEGINFSSFVLSS